MGSVTAGLVPRRADQLAVGDRIEPQFLPAFCDQPAEALFVREHDFHRDRWVFVAFAQDDGFHDSTSFLPEAELLVIPAADPSGLSYSRAVDEPDDPTPVSPARVPLHTGAMTDCGLVDESDDSPFAPLAHLDSCQWPGASCTCQGA